MRYGKPRLRFYGGKFRESQLAHENNTVSQTVLDGKNHSNYASGAHAQQGVR